MVAVEHLYTWLPPPMTKLCCDISFYAILQNIIGTNLQHRPPLLGLHITTNDHLRRLPTSFPG